MEPVFFFFDVFSPGQKSSWKSGLKGFKRKGEKNNLRVLEEVINQLIKTRQIVAVRKQM